LLVSEAFELLVRVGIYAFKSTVDRQFLLIVCKKKLYYSTMLSHAALGLKPLQFLLVSIQ